jgi:hypothetical protein
LTVAQGDESSLTKGESLVLARVEGSSLIEAGGSSVLLAGGSSLRAEGSSPQPESSSPQPEASSPQPEESSTSAHAESLAHLLPANSFAQISPRCYVFPGAEVTLDNMEGDSEDSDDDFSDDDEEDENEVSSANANEIIVPDIDDELSVVAVPEVSPTPIVSSPSPTPFTPSQLQCNDRETAENILDIQADEAKEDVEPAPIKRPRLHDEAGEVF